MHRLEKTANTEEMREYGGGVEKQGREGAWERLRVYWEGMRNPGSKACCTLVWGSEGRLPLSLTPSFPPLKGAGQPVGARMA